MFKNRKITFTHLNEKGFVVSENISNVPDDQIVCDACNALILTEEINLLFYELDGEERVWGVGCDECAKKWEEDD